MSENKGISVTRALAELKTLNKRISKLTNEITFASTRVTGRPWQDHVSDTKSKYQSLLTLMLNYNKIKYAIAASNSVTKVIIVGREFTITEALITKESICHQKALLSKLKKCRNDVNNEVENHTYKVQDNLNRLLETSFGQNRKAESDDVKGITEAYLKNNKIEIIDPLNLSKTIEMLEQEISEFEKEVDFALSESNALTKIYV
jgi:hypothetical protein